MRIIRKNDIHIRNIHGRMKNYTIGEIYSFFKELHCSLKAKQKNDWGRPISFLQYLLKSYKHASLSWHISFILYKISLRNCSSKIYINLSLFPWYVYQGWNIKTWKLKSDLHNHARIACNQIDIFCMTCFHIPLHYGCFAFYLPRSSYLFYEVEHILCK